MSRQLINAYLNEIDRLKKFSGTTTEGVISEAFKDSAEGLVEGQKSSIRRPIPVPLEPKDANPAGRDDPA